MMHLAFLTALVAAVLWLGYLGWLTRDDEV
jgi:hypothetical protein